MRYQGSFGVPGRGTPPAPSMLVWAKGCTTTGLVEGTAPMPLYQRLPTPRASIGFFLNAIAFLAVVAMLASYPVLRYGVWQAAITYLSSLGGVSSPLLHGRTDVVTNADLIRRYAPDHLELMVARRSRTSQRPR